MNEVKIISVNDNEITLQRTYNIKINNEYELVQCWLEDAIDSLELSVIRKTLFPNLTDEQFDDIANQIDNEE